MYPYSVYTYIPTHPLYAHTQRERETQGKKERKKKTRFASYYQEKKKKKIKSSIRIKERSGVSRDPTQASKDAPAACLQESTALT